MTALLGIHPILAYCRGFERRSGYRRTYRQLSMREVTWTAHVKIFMTDTLAGSSMC
jgi:hypothetical protein